MNQVDQLRADNAAYLEWVSAELREYNRATFPIIDLTKEQASLDTLFTSTRDSRPMWYWRLWNWFSAIWELTQCHLRQLRARRALRK